MAYLYRGAQSPRDEPPPTYTNPLSPQRTPNRLSAGVMGPPMVNSDVRGGLTRRFTTNALPTLTPIGQQRRQAAGDYTVSACVDVKIVWAVVLAFVSHSLVLFA